MGRTIHLLGAPRIESSDGAVGAPAGKKAWAILAYLFCAGAPVERGEIASLLFADADDPMRALRWNLSELRKALAVGDSFKGNLLTIDALQDWTVDVNVLKRASWASASALPGLGKDLLAGYAFPGCDSFEAWLLCERRHLRSTSEAVLREMVEALSARGDHEGAVAAALQLVTLEPLDETNQAALIRAYVAAGDHATAKQQAGRVVEMFERELGVEVGSQFSHILEQSARTPSRMGDGLVKAKIDVANAALAAGQTEKGIEVLREALAGAGDDPHLRSQTSFALGSALNHSYGARKEEGRSLLVESLETSRSIGEPELATSALLELAWSDYLAAEYERATARVHEAWATEPSDPAVRAGLHWIEAKGLVEAGRYSLGLERLQESLDLAELAGDIRWQVLSLTALGRCDVARRRLDEAAAYLEDAIRRARTMGWMWAISLPESYLSEVDLLRGDLPSAETHAEHALALAREVSDPSLECTAGRVASLVRARVEGPQAGIEMLDATRRAAVERLDYVWAIANTLDALADLTSETHHADAAYWIDESRKLASAKGIQEFIVRSYIYASRLGDESQLDTAEALARRIENPFLHSWIADLVNPTTGATAPAPSP